MRLRRELAEAKAETAAAVAVRNEAQAEMAKMVAEKERVDFAHEVCSADLFFNFSECDPVLCSGK